MCEYVLPKGQKLYTLKWYHEEHEFWRFEPRARPKYQALNVPGVSIDVRETPSIPLLRTNHYSLHFQRSLANSTHVLLKNLSSRSSGNYSCEVSVEGTYMTLIRDGKLTVIRE